MLGEWYDAAGKPLPLGDRVQDLFDMAGESDEFVLGLETDPIRGLSIEVTVRMHGPKDSVIDVVSVSALGTR